MLTHLSTIKAHVVCAAIALLLLMQLDPPNASAVQALQAQTPQARYEEAALDLRTQRWASAYAGFARLADAGHEPSAEMARWMHRQGAALFGSEWSATQEQQLRWDAMIVDALRRTPPTDDLASAE